MDEVILYRAIQSNEIAKVAALFFGSFSEFVGSEYSEQGKEEFRKYTESGALRQRLKLNHFILVAVADAIIVGAIEIRDNDHVVLLFVDKRFHKRGIARKLLENAIVAARVEKPNLDHFTVNSSRYALPVYKKLGFQQTGPERAVNGILFIPMARRLEEVDQ